LGISTSWANESFDLRHLWCPLKRTSGKPGVTAGLDAALVVASLLRGDTIAQEIQLSIQYAPNSVFHSGGPETAPAEVLEAFNESYSAMAESREAEARRFAAILGVAA